MPKWKSRFTTVDLHYNKPVAGERPLRYWGDLKQKYEAHNTDDTGMWQG